jgi:hypothetical protein
MLSYALKIAVKSGAQQWLSEYTKISKNKTRQWGNHGKPTGSVKCHNDP